MERFILSRLVVMWNPEELVLLDPAKENRGVYEVKMNGNHQSTENWNENP